MTKRLLQKKSNGKFPFTYHNSANTDVAATFRRIRRELKESAAKEQQKVSHLPVRKVTK